MYATVTDIIIVVELFSKLETYDNSYLENIITYWKESEQRKKLENKFGLFQIQLWGLRGVTTLRKLCNFCPELSKETVFFFFLLNTPNFTLVSSTNILCLKDYPHNLTKYEIKWTTKIPVFQLFCELGTILYWKNPIFDVFNEFEKTGESNWYQQPETNTKKIPILNLWMNWENLFPNLGFTV